MFFNKRDKEIEEIKKAVQEQEPVREEREEAPTIDDLEVTDLDFPESRFPQRESAPLFVKVNKYKELIELIGEMKAFNDSLKQMFVVMNEAENVRNDALKMMRATVNRLDKSLMEIDSELVRPEGIDLENVKTADTEVRYIERSLSDLQRQLAVLRKDMQDFKE